MLKRFPLVVCALIAMDLLLKGMVGCCFDWRISLTKTIVTAVLGLSVIAYYEWRWSAAVVARLEKEQGYFDSWSFERILLLIAGIVLVFPGIMIDFVGVVLLMPWVRRLIAQRVCPIEHGCREFAGYSARAAIGSR